MEQSKPDKIDVRLPQQFDGMQVHCTEPFIGMRYSLVFFTVRGAENASKAAQSELVHKGALCDSWQVQAA